MSLVCPLCRAEKAVRVIDSRNAGDGTARRRRYECASCNRRFTTYEVYFEDTPPGRADKMTPRLGRIAANRILEGAVKELNFED